MANTIEKAGTDRKAIRDELAKMQNFVGMTGKFSFTERRDVKRDYHYLIVKNGAWALLRSKHDTTDDRHGGRERPLPPWHIRQSPAQGRPCCYSRS